MGQKLTTVILKQMVATNEVPDALLFQGPRGTGKTSVARILAMALNPSERDSILSGDSLAVIEIDAASNGTVASVRSLIDELRFSVGAEKRVVILDEAHSITREAFNALLKTLEEPPEGVVFVLVTTEPQRIPDTVLDRLTEFEFRRVQPTDIVARLLAIASTREVKMERELLDTLADEADGSVRQAIKNLDFCYRANITTAGGWRDINGRRDLGPLLFAALLSGDNAKIFSVLDTALAEAGDVRLISDALNEVFTDIFVLKAGGEVKAVGKALENRVKLAKIVPLDNLYPAVSVLWDLKTKVRWTENQQAALATALILIGAKLSTGLSTSPVIAPETAPVAVASEPEPEVRALSLSEMMSS